MLSVVYAVCRVFIAMLNVFVLSVVRLSVVVPNQGLVL
jgi:hypothetical protein